MHLKIIQLVILVFTVTNGQLLAQSSIQNKIDSLNQLYAIKTGTEKIDVLIELGSELSHTDLDSSIRTFHLAMLQSQEIGNEKKKTLAKIKLASTFNYQNMYDSALFYFEEAEKESREYDDYDLESTIYMNRGITYFYQSEFSKARQEFTTALSLAKRVNEVKDMSRAYNNIGLTHQYQGNYEDAFEYLLQSANIEDSLGNELAAAKSYNNMATLLSDLHNYEEAQIYYQKSLDIKIKHGDKRGTVGTYINQAILYKNMGRYQQSLGIYQKALELARAINYRNGIVDILNNLAVLNNHLLNFEAAISHTKEALDLIDQSGAAGKVAMLKMNLCDSYRLNGQAKKAEKMVPQVIREMEAVGNTRHKHEAYKIISQLYEDLHKYDLALSYFKKHKQLGDSIFNQEKDKSILELKTQYETEKKEQEIELLSIENQLKESEITQANQRFYASIGGIGLLLLSVFLYFNRYKHKQRALLAEEKSNNQRLGFKLLIEGEEKERKRIAQELHDGLGQILSTARLNVSAMEDNIAEVVARQWQNSIKLIDDAVTEVRHISHNMMPNALISIGFEAAIKEQIHIINDAGQVMVHAQLPEQKIDLEESVSIALYRIIQEVLNNAIKFAEAKNIWLDIQTGDQLVISIKDDGKGFDTNIVADSSGIGWQNIRSRMEILNGELNIASELGKGSKISLKLAV